MITIDPDVAPNSAAPSLALSKPALTHFLNRARIAIGLSGAVSVLLTTDAELKRLNRTFRNKNKPTDILSFPAPSEIATHYAGDLAISLDTAGRQATSFGHPLETELRILLLHGLLHLSGLDHETDNGKMADREAQLRTRFRLPNTLIARTTEPSPAKPKDPEPRKNVVILSEAQRSRRTRFSTHTAETSTGSLPPVERRKSRGLP